MAEFTAQQQQQLEAIIADALRAEGPPEAAALVDLGDLKDLFCKNWDTVKGVLTFIKSLPVGPVVKAAINTVIRIGDGIHGTIC